MVASAQIVHLLSASLIWISLGAEAQQRATDSSNRCRCYCNLKPLLKNTSLITQHSYSGVEDGDDCNCENVVLPQIYSKIDKDKLVAVCAFCDCRFQSRKVLVIQVAVYGTSMLILLLVLHLLLTPLLQWVKHRLWPARRADEEPIMDHLELSPGGADHFTMTISVLGTVCVVCVLLLYMLALHALSFSRKLTAKRRLAASAGCFENINFTYERCVHNDEDGSVHANSSIRNGAHNDLAGASAFSSGAPAPKHSRSRSGSIVELASNAVRRATQQQSKWIQNVKEQRRHIFRDHSVLN